MYQAELHASWTLACQRFLHCLSATVNVKYEQISLWLFTKHCKTASVHGQFESKALGKSPDTCCFIYKSDSQLEAPYNSPKWLLNSMITVMNNYAQSQKLIHIHHIYKLRSVANFSQYVFHWLLVNTTPAQENFTHIKTYHCSNISTTAIVVKLQKLLLLLLFSTAL